MIYQLLRHACAALAFNATWEALQAPGWTEAQLASLQSTWETCDFAHDMGAAMEMERAMSLDFYEQVKHSKAKLAFAIDQREKAAEFMEESSESFPTHGIILKWFHVPL